MIRTRFGIGCVLITTIAACSHSAKVAQTASTTSPPVQAAPTSASQVSASTSLAASPTPTVTVTVTALPSSPAPVPTPSATATALPQVWIYIEPPANQCLNRPGRLPKSTDTYELRAPSNGLTNGAVLGVTNAGWGREGNCGVGAAITLDPVPNPPIVEVVDATDGTQWGPIDLRNYVVAADQGVTAT